MQNICAKDFFTPTNFNCDTKNQLWMSIIADSHDSICNCWHPFAHMLASIFPPGHSDRNHTIEEILQRDYKERCHSGGHADASHGMEDSGAATGTDPIKREEGEEEDLPEEEISKLLAAAAEEGTSGVAHKQQIHQLMTQNYNQHMMYPVCSKKQYKLRIQKNKPQNPFSTPGTSEGGLLHKELLKECQKASKLIHLSNLMIQKHQRKRKRSPKHSQTTKSKRKRYRNVSSLSAKAISAKKKPPTSKSTSSSSSSSSSSSNKTSTSSSSTSS
nr:hypothetical protein [Torque teno midi virus]